MHYCGIIIKPKSMSIENARKLLGDYLVKIEIADWYSTDNYRERTFEGKQTISVKEFASIFEESWLEQLSEMTEEDKYITNYTWAFGIITSISILRIEDDKVFSPIRFWEFYDLDDSYRRDLINAYIRAYKVATKKVLKDLLATNAEEYDVVLLDYHS